MCRKVVNPNSLDPALALTDPRSLDPPPSPPPRGSPVLPRSSSGREVPNKGRDRFGMDPDVGGREAFSQLEACEVKGRREG
jgi:hypothetical protein